jgi:hypothetical protein
MPGTIGNWRTTGEVPVIANPSLKLRVEYSTFTVTSSLGKAEVSMVVKVDRYSSFILSMHIALKIFN